MARALRVEFAGAAYHVMNRGNRRQTVFEQDRDYELFLRKLAEFAAVYDVSLRTYCLMPNHFHLYLVTRQANLSAFMQALLTAFTVSKNRREGQSGHLFQGRFKAMVIEAESYEAVVSRYIALNPVRTEFWRQQPVAARRRHLRDYPWSSYGALIGLRTCPEWLDARALLAAWPGASTAQVEAYREFVEEGLMREIEDPMATAPARAVLGTEPFVDRIRRAFTVLEQKANLRREKAQAGVLARCVPLAAVLRAVSAEYGVGADVLSQKGVRGSEARQCLIYLASTWCHGSQTLTRVSESVGLSLGGLTSGAHKFRQRLQSCPALRRRVEAVAVRLTAAEVK